MLDLPEELLLRFDESDAADLVAIVESLAAGLTEQYAVEKRAFSLDDFDDGLTYAWGLRQRSFNRSADGVADRVNVEVRNGGVRQSMSVAGVTVRSYRFGSQAPEDIHLEQLEIKSQLRQMMVLDNDERAQLRLDIRGAVNPAPMIASSYDSNELVVAHYGSASKGLQAMFLGAPLSVMADGSYWAWVIQLSGSQDEGLGDDELDRAGPSGPSGPTPYDAGAEPELPIAPRKTDTRREQ